MNSQLIIRDGDVDHAYNCANGFVSRCVAAVHVENHSDARKLARILNDHFQSALSHQPAPVAANASAELSKFANDLAAKQEPLGVQISAEALEGAYIRDEPTANASAEVCALREKLSAALAGGLHHKSDCAVYLAPAYEPRECDCGAKDASAEARLREALTTVEDLIRRDPACFNLSDELQSVRSVLREALSAHHHASDCDKQGTTKTEASSHEKRRLDASGGQPSTGPETSISPVRIIAQRHVSTPDANHDVTAGETATIHDGDSGVKCPEKQPRSLSEEGTGEAAESSWESTRDDSEDKGGIPVRTLRGETSGLPPVPPHESIEQTISSKSSCSREEAYSSDLSRNRKMQSAMRKLSCETSLGSVVKRDRQPSDHTADVTGDPNGLCGCTWTCEKRDNCRDRARNTVGRR